MILFARCGPINNEYYVDHVKPRCDDDYANG